ncbi:hypothetical protein RRF57_011009 [Xylaria bambusicola]|uniref:Uncharacterized protein n=1 Tax=Xylaria bambusicola TaxID=326684 RepID=A0AAN7Z9A1_9PEZI
MTKKGLRVNQSDLFQIQDNTAVLYLWCDMGRKDSNVGIPLTKTPYGYVCFIPGKIINQGTLRENGSGFLPANIFDSTADAPVFLSKILHPEDADLIHRYSIRFKFEIDKHAEVLIWPRSFYNSAIQRAFFHTHPLRQATLF